MSDWWPLTFTQENGEPHPTARVRLPNGESWSIYDWRRNPPAPARRLVRHGEPVNFSWPPKDTRPLPAYYAVRNVIGLGDATPAFQCNDLFELKCHFAARIAETSGE